MHPTTELPWRAFIRRIFCSLINASKGGGSNAQHNERCLAARIFCFLGNALLPFRVRKNKLLYLSPRHWEVLVEQTSGELNHCRCLKKAMKA